MPSQTETDQDWQRGFFLWLRQWVIKRTLPSILRVFLAWGLLSFAMGVLDDKQMKRRVLDQVPLDLVWYDLTLLSEGYIKDGIWRHINESDSKRERSFALPDGFNGLSRCGQNGFGPIEDIPVAPPDSLVVRGCWIGPYLLTDRMLIETFDRL